LGVCGTGGAGGCSGWGGWGGCGGWGGWGGMGAAPGAAVRLAPVVVVVRAVDELRTLWRLECDEWRERIDLFLDFFFWQRQ
jgi:hypothetical protein